VSPKLPGCPEWCPANHFGYLQAGTMKVQYKDGSTETVNAGSSYNIPPGACVWKKVLSLFSNFGD
jgi:hypothetical protein|tara:strand:+ start:468 stop:662 length:195 start_codon:yes stop_codon:yes gene_type:complete